MPGTRSLLIMIMAAVSTTHDTGTELSIESQDDGLTCEGDDTFSQAIITTLSTGGSVDSAVAYARVDDGAMVQVGSILSSDFVHDGRIKRATLRFSLSLSHGAHRVSVCFEQSGSQGRPPKLACAPTLLIDSGTACSPCPPYPEAVLEDSPIAYWRLGDPPGAWASDSSDHDHVGSVFGSVNAAQPSLLARDPDPSMSFTFGGIAIPTTGGLVLDASAGATVEAWVRTTSVGPQLIFSQQKCTPDTVQLWISEGRGMFRVTTDYFVDIRAYGSTRVDDGQVHHVVGLRDVSTRQLRLYVDGVLDATVEDLTRTTGSLTSPGTDTWIGRRTWCGQTNEFNGTIDEVAIYGNALTEPRIQKHHWRGAGCPL